ncbi:MAG: hypothetical protein IJD67_06380 [Clostridia bacterium]|nr:hypothetical protein [Clostridia bacterium]
MRIVSFVITVLVLMSLFPLTLGASELDAALIEEYIPEDIKDTLPDGIFDKENTGIADKLSFSYFLESIKNAFASVAGGYTADLATLVSLLIISSLFHLLSQSTKGSLDGAFSGISSLCVCVYIFTVIAALFETVAEYLGTLASFASAVTPVVSIAYAAGGNISAATVSNSGLMLCIAVIENICAYFLYPLLSLIAAMTVASSLAPAIRINTLTGFLRGVMMLGISFTVTAISAIMSLQHTLACASDTLGARAVRFAASSFIPIVGSAVSEAVRTVAGSVGYIRSSIGGIGIVVVILITLPVFISLMLVRINLAISASLSDMLGCERETQVLKQASLLVNVLIALVSLSAFMFVYFLTLLLKCSSAYA